MSFGVSLQSGKSAKRRVVIVADPGRESAGALQWALSHAVLEEDEIFLLHVEPRKSGGATSLSTFLKRPMTEDGGGIVGGIVGGIGGSGYYEFLEGMRSKCMQVQPKVKVQVEKVHELSMYDQGGGGNGSSGGTNKANTILSQAKILCADLLVIGQARRSSFLGGKLSIRGIDTAEYLIENSRCLCVGVQKKGQNAGYLLNTKTHKNFWLLA